jgi:hypothetical protein
MEELRQLLVSFANGLTDEKDVQEGMNDILEFFGKHRYLIPHTQQIFCDASECAFNDGDKGAYSDCGSASCDIINQKCTSYALDYDGED